MDKDTKQKQAVIILNDHIVTEAVVPDINNLKPFIVKIDSSDMTSLLQNLEIL